MNAGGASEGSRDRRSRKRGTSGAMFGLLAAVIAAVLVLGLGAGTVMSRPSSCPQPVVAHVAASGDIAAVVRQLGRFFNRQHAEVDGHCAQVAVHAAAPAPVAAQFAAGRAGPRQPRVDAWIPDSQLWIGVARATPSGARRVPATGPVLARTDLVIAMPRANAARLPAYGTSVGWNFLLPQSDGGPATALGLNVQFPDPAQSAAGLATLIEVRKLLGYGRLARFALARFVFNVQVVTSAPGGTTLTSLSQPPSQAGAVNPVTVTSEQAVVQFDRSHPGPPLAVRYPAGGSYELTYPYLVTASDRVTAAAAKAFGAELQSRYASQSVRYEGFRSGNGLAAAWPAAYGLPQREPAPLPPPAPATAAATLHAWQKLSLGLRILALNDVSAAMAVRAAPGGPTLEEVLGHAAAIALARFPNSTQMGLWAFASRLPGGAAYRQLVPMGPLPAPFGLLTRRQAIEHLAASAGTVRAGALLYRTILAAYQQMTSTYQARYWNAVIVLTAGVDSPRGDIPVPALLHDLKMLYDRNKPVNIDMIMVGQAGDFAVMRQIAAATNGKPYDITSPAQISQVFYQAMGRRICEPHCPK
jgi:hypothetical protein